MFNYKESLQFLGKIFTAIFSFLKAFKDIATAIIFVLLLAAFFSSTIRSQLGIFFAKNYGLKGHAYYEVDGGGQLTNLGRLYLLRSGERQFDKVVPGDRLMAADGVNLRTTEDKKSNNNIIYVLAGGNCVVVLEPGSNVPQTTNVKGSGGWLMVATAPCELFDRPKPFS